MSRHSKGPRLYLDRRRGAWVIRDGPHFVRTGCATHQRDRAETLLAEYLGTKHRPKPSPEPLIADVLLAYAQEHVPHTKTARDVSYILTGYLSTWWGSKRLSDVTAVNCRMYAKGCTPSMGRKGLEVLQAALRHWHREHHPIIIPRLVMPPRAQPRERWLTRSEAARLLWAARRAQHLKRFILLGLHTGSRAAVLWSLTWDQVDFHTGILHRRARGVAEDAHKRTPPIKLGRKILAHLRRWKRQDGNPPVHWVCHWDGQRIKGARKSWSRARTRAGLDSKVTQHTLRHTRATWMAQRGVPIWEAAGYLGMSVAVFQSVYGHHHPGFQKNASAV